MAEAIHLCYFSTDDWRGRPARRRATYLLQKIVADGCDDPLVRLLSVADAVPADEFGDDTLVRLGDAPEKLRDGKFPAALQCAAFALRAEATLLAARGQPTATTVRLGNADLDQAAQLWNMTDPDDYASPAAPFDLLSKMAFVRVRLQPDDADASVIALLNVATQKHQDRGFSLAARLTAEAAAVKAIDSAMREQKQLLWERINKDEATAAGAAYATDEDVLRARLALAITWQDTVLIQQLLPKIVAIDPDPELVDRCLPALSHPLPSFEGDTDPADRAQHVSQEKAATDLLRWLERAQPDSSDFPLQYARGCWINTGASVGHPESFVKDAWPSAKAALERHLRQRPNDRLAHAHYAFFAAVSGEWRVAHMHFELAGDAEDDPTGESLTQYEYLRDRAAELGK